MSNNLASHRLSIQSSQMGQLEPKLDSSMQMGLGTSSLQQMSMSNMGGGSVGSAHNGTTASQQMKMSNLGVGPVGPGYNGSESQQLSIANMEMGTLQPVSNDLGSQILPMSNEQTGQMDTQTYNMVSQQFFPPTSQWGELGTLSNNVTYQQLSLLNKRKAPMEPSVMQKSSPSNKRVAQLEHRPWLQPVSGPDKRVAQQMQFMSNSTGSQHSPASNKKVVQKDSVPGKSAPQKPLMQKSQNAHLQSSAKVQSGSLESVRSKMRENLAAALALVSQDKSSNAEKSSQNEAATIPGKLQGISQPNGSVLAASDTVEPVSAAPKEAATSKEGSSAMSTDVRSGTQQNFTNGNTSTAMQIPKCSGEDFQYGNHLPDEDVPFSDNFFARDELLQGNGLSWVLEPVIGVQEKNELPTVENQELRNQKVVGDGGRGEPPPDQSPQILASKIEAELFKLFGGVNKKYKEKGRSLLFNLKDHNNPELREKVMSGEILPERLCSMTAEELASKELSQWRMAKAQELAQMVVLPDSDVDIRRMVKKTHKGEFQVEVEQVDTTSMDVSLGISSHDRRSGQENEGGASPPSKSVQTKEESNAAATEKKSNLEGQEDQCTITIPSSEATDLMQGLMVDNEMKDAEFLPPIVSLDEFMESLNSEPPFEDISGDAEKSTPTPKLDRDDTEVGSKSKSLQTQQDPVNATPAKHDNVEGTETKSDTISKHNDSPVKSETAAPVVASKSELVWEGLLQLNISAMASVTGIFKSGEKTSTKEWASFLEIKGRVKLDAFEKYLQQLPMSRSRAVMIMHVVGKEASPKSDRKNLSEVAESYVSDGRVGIAEPGPGIELYFCPPHSKTIDLLSKIVPKDHLEALGAIDNGLIGVLVWKKAQLTSTISPNSASHHKHASKKHFTSTRRHQDKDTTTTTTNTNMNTPSRPVDQIRELIHKYGQPQGAASSDRRGIGVAIQPWNDDDDDIPEWQPQSAQPVHGYKRPPMVNQQRHVGLMQPHEQYRQPSLSLQPQMNVMQAPQQNQWTQHGTYTAPPSQPGAGGVQFYGQPGAAWRQDAPKSRGF
ncbi:hypothetical protein CUMW_200040 [Citrus unshiu]|uniref:TFIIS central domain-containing protein n=1 Tax=Citrus unshiu TaxID=55188 RepID=A0A2H5Q6C2_CITUN|nr:hypothetical protein CUMW_200040 [Citrus unshiu]